MQNRTQRIDVLDTATGAVLATQTVSSFGQGRYVRFRVRGQVRIVVVQMAGDNAVVSGLFIDPATGDNSGQRFVSEPSSGNAMRAVGVTSGGATVARQYHADALQSVEAVTGASGLVEADYTLDAFGNALPGSGTAAENPFVFHGGLGYWSEPELGLTYVRQRWLDTNTGQWLSPDPVEGEPRYNYAYNSPKRFTDPSGMQPPNPLQQMWQPHR